MEIVVRVRLDPEQLTQQQAAALAAECAAYVEGMVETHPVMRAGLMSGRNATADYEMQWSVES